MAICGRELSSVFLAQAESTPSRNRHPGVACYRFSTVGANHVVLLANPKPFFLPKITILTPWILDKFPADRTKSRPKSETFFFGCASTRIFKMDPKTEIVQDLIKKLTPGLYKWNPEFIHRLYSKCFFPNESDDKEETDRRAWKQRPKPDYQTYMFWIDHRVNMNYRDPMYSDGKEYRNNYRMSWAEVETPSFPPSRCIGETHSNYVVMNPLYSAF